MHRKFHFVTRITVLLALSLLIFMIFTPYPNVQLHISDLNATVDMDVPGPITTDQGFGDFADPPNPDNPVDVDKEDKELPCRFPRVDLNNKDVLPFMVKKKEIQCTNKNYPALFKVDVEGNLITIGNFSAHGFSECCYRQILRKSDLEADASIICHEVGLKSIKVNPSYEFIGVMCSKETGAPQYVDMFAMVPPKKSKYSSTPGPKVNVIVLGVDATSHLNFQRIMPKSWSYLTKNLSAIGLQSLNKHGDNTLPNMITALTGYSIDEVKKLCWPNHKYFFDSCPFIWKQFSWEGYMTVYAEDLASVGTFSYGKRGFQKIPTDYYPRPLTAFQEKHIHSNWQYYMPLCLGPRTASEVQMDYANRLLQSLEKRKQNYFAFFWFESLTHSSLTLGAQLDHSLLTTIEHLQRSNYLNNTVLLVMSDHGFLLGDYMNTEMGGIESKLPFVYFTLPPWFKSKYPSAVENLERNARSSLTTYFDVYKTLKDLLVLDSFLPNHKIEERTRNLMNETTVPKSISLFLPVPKSRTCKSAGIPTQYCVCNTLPKIKNLTHPLVQSAAVFLTERVNGVIRRSKAPCAPLKLMKVMRAQGMFEANEGELASGSNFLHALTIVMEPGNGTFAATLKGSTGTGSGNDTTEVARKTTNKTHNHNVTWKVLGEITRTNSYGNQSACVSDFALKNFCYCQREEIIITSNVNK